MLWKYIQIVLNMYKISKSILNSCMIVDFDLYFDYVILFPTHKL